MNRQLLRLSLLLLFLPLLHVANAQCKYKLQLSDASDDGWEGGTLKVTTGTTVISFTLDDGGDSTATFPVANGQPLKLEWTLGDFNTEVSFILYDYYGNLLYQVSNPGPGTLFTGTGVCPECIEPDNVRTENVYDTYAKLRWSPVSINPSLGWWVIYGLKGFSVAAGAGDSVYVTTNKHTLTGLSKKTEYDFYVLEMCDSTEFPPIVGPISFQTYWSDDVGISGVVTPLSGCDLGEETVKIIMSNYGSNPQSLIPFRFSVNGIDAGVSQPQDGFYTGVLGKDSSTVIEFETTYNFSAPGEYLITVYTEMEGDEDILNDTFHYYIVNRLVTPYTQDFEVWSGGWYVDTASINSSWELGVPSNQIISAAASGKNAWATNLDGDYNFFEESYLNSPCFDFSGLVEDPVIEFSINYSTDLDFDGGYLEMSTDDGGAWDKVGAVGEGSNWYNFTNTLLGLGDVWSGESEGWKTARIRLLDMAGESGVRFRFVFNSFFLVHEGMGIDNIKIYVPLKNDLAGSAVTTEGDANNCGLEEDKIEFTFSNFGTQPQSVFQVGYSVNGGAPVIELVNATVQPDANFTYTFTTPFNSLDSLLTIKCWTTLLNEQNLVNDTAYYTVDHRARPVPFQENFESQQLPSGWKVTGDPEVTNGSGNTSFVLEANLYTDNTEFAYDLPRYGLISAEDSLTFDYRIADFDGGGTVATVLSGGTNIKVQVSSDCDSYQTLYEINNLTHTPSLNLKKVALSLGSYAGQAVNIRFAGTWTDGDFFFDLDNINLRACATDMQLTPTVTPSTNGQNGAATVNVGLGNSPYTYLWSNDSTTQTISGLAIGQYKVTVTDALGCTDELTINVGAVSTQEIEGLTLLTLRPNPTNGVALLNAVFDHAVDANVEVINMLGQQLWEANASLTTSLTEQIDLANFPDGLYLVRLTVAGQTVTKKLVKNR